MSIRFRLLTEADVKAVLTLDDLIETMASALVAFSSKRVQQPFLNLGKARRRQLAELGQQPRLASDLNLMTQRDGILWEPAIACRNQYGRR